MQDDDDEEHDHALFQKSAATAEAVFYRYSGRHQSFTFAFLFQTRFTWTCSVNLWGKSFGFGGPSYDGLLPL